MRAYARLSLPSYACALAALSAFSVSSYAIAQDPQQWTLAKISDLGSGPDELFQSVQFGQVLPNGRIVVADDGLKVIRIYNSTGSRIVEVGGNGGGPGEFASIRGLWTTSAGAIGVWDPGNLRFTRFDHDGQLLGTSRVRAEDGSGGNLEVFFGVFPNDDVVLAALSFGERQSYGEIVPDRWELIRFSSDGEFAGSLGSTSGLWRGSRGPAPFSPLPQVQVSGDTVLIADPFEPAISVHDASGARARSLRIEGVSGSSADVKAAHNTLRAELEDRNNTMFLGLLDEIPLPDRLPATAGMLVDEVSGYIWVKQYDPNLDRIWLKGNALRLGRGGTWHVIDRTGQNVASVELPGDLRLLDVRGATVLAVRSDDLDVEHVEILEIH